MGRDVHDAGRSSCTRTRQCAFKKVDRYLRKQGIIARITRIGVDSSERVGRHRWVVEGTLSWLLAFYSLATSYHSSDTTIIAVAILTITVICARRLTSKTIEAGF